MAKELVMLCMEANEADLRRQGLAAEEKGYLRTDVLWGNPNEREPEIHAAQYPSKWDGTRVKIEKKNGKVTLINRRGVNYTRRLTERRYCGVAKERW